MKTWLTRLGLSFDDPTFERQWRDEYYRRSLVQVRLATGVAVVIYGSYGFVDPIILPPEVAGTNLWPQRLLSSFVIALVFASSFASWFERSWQALLIAGVMSAVAGLTWMWLVLELSVYWYYHNGLVLILVFSFLVLRLTFRSSLILASLTYLLFLAMTFGLRPAPDINVVTATSLAFVSLIGLFVSYQLEANERKIYWQNSLIESQRTNLQNSLDDLESTQEQLIQSEKMASLGHLSAGIAHEIRNPLNFVTNFAAVSKEIIEELESDLRAIEGAPVMTNDVVEALGQLDENADHIQRHGTRADKIVQRLIEQADRVGGTRIRADLNEVVAAGIEAAASRFVTKTKRELPELRVQYAEPAIEVEMVRKDIGKVVDNLIDNALHSVSVKQADDEQFEGLVSVKVEIKGNAVSVQIMDNGVGISDETRKRIFEPFFTTRPPGEGTGLGLFLSYQIIASHLGEIKVASRNGQFAKFEFTLPRTESTLEAIQ